MLKKSLLTLTATALLFSQGFVNQAYAQIDAPSAQATNNPMPKLSKSANQLSSRMREAFHQQIAKEQYSSNLYLTFASYFADVGLDGCEAFFRHSSAEEQEHALLFFNHLIDRNEKFQMRQVDASALMPTSPLDAFTKLLENEIQVTKSIHNLYLIAVEEKDYASQAFLIPFLNLQVEEEKQAQDLLQLLVCGATDPAFLIAFDEKVAETVEED